jgi:hypothetical protein
MLHIAYYISFQEKNWDVQLHLLLKEKKNYQSPGVRPRLTNLCPWIFFY